MTPRWTAAPGIATVRLTIANPVGVAEVGFWLMLLSSGCNPFFSLPVV